MEVCFHCQRITQELTLRLVGTIQRGADKGMYEDGDNWDSVTNPSASDSVDILATDDRMQLPPDHSLRDHHLTGSSHPSPITLHSENPAGLSKSCEFYPRGDTSFNPYLAYSRSFTSDSSSSPFNTSWSGLYPYSTNGYVALTNSRLAPSPHLVRPSFSPGAENQPASGLEEQLGPWVWQHNQPSPINNSRHPAPLSAVPSLPTPAAVMPKRPKRQGGTVSTRETSELQNRPSPSSPRKRPPRIPGIGKIAVCDVRGCGMRFPGEERLKLHIQSVHAPVKESSSSPLFSHLVQHLT